MGVFTESAAKVFGDGKEFLGDYPRIGAGDKIGFAVDVNKHLMSIYHNGTLVKTLKKVGTPGKPLYPCAFLGGSQTIVRIQKPSFNYVVVKD